MTDGCGGAHCTWGPGSRRFESQKGHASLPHSNTAMALGPEACPPTKLSERALVQDHGLTNTHVMRRKTASGGIPRGARRSSRLEHEEAVGAHPGGGEGPVWELLSQSIQLGGLLIFPRKVVGSNGHRDHSFRPLFRDLAEKISLVLRL